MHNDDDLWNALEDVRVMIAPFQLPKPLEGLHKYLQIPSSSVDRAKLLTAAITCVQEMLDQAKHALEQAERNLSQTGINSNDKPDRLKVQVAKKSVEAFNEHTKLQPLVKNLLETLQVS